MKKIAFFFFLFFNLTSVFYQSALADDFGKILIFKPGDNEPIPTIIRNVRASMAKSHPRVEIEEIKTIDEKKAAGLIRSQKPSLVLLVGVDIGKSLTELTEKVPIVISDVFTPNYMETFRDKRIIIHNFNIPITKRIEYIEKILPGPQTIGVIFNPNKNAAIVEAGKQYCQNRGLILKKIAVTSEKDIQAIKSLQIDVLLLIPDSLVCSLLPLKHIMMLCLEENIPIMGLSERFAQMGTAMAISPDLEDYSEKLSQTLTSLLDDTDPETIPDVYPEKIDYFINIAIARKAVIVFKEGAPERAKKVFGE